MFEHLLFRDDEWFLLSPDGEHPLGPSMVDRLPDNVHALSGQQIKQNWKEVDPLPPHCDNRGFHRPTPGVQGKRNTCVSFALNAAIEGRLARDNRAEYLSAQYTNGVLMAGANPPRDWCSQILLLQEGAEILKLGRTCAERECDYAPSIAQCRAMSVPDKSKCHPRYGIGACDYVTGEAVGDPDAIRTLICAQYDVAIAVLLRLGRFHASADRVHTAAPGERAPVANVPQPAGHAMVIVGYGMDGSVPYFECYDSLGLSAAWSHGGYVRVSPDYLRAYAYYGIVVTQAIDEGPPA